MSELNIETFIADLAQYMKSRDAVSTAYAFVCNPAIYVEVSAAVNTDRSPFVDGYKAIALHEWCPLDTIYLPQSKEEYDRLIASLDELGAKMTGKMCIMPHCTEPAAIVHDVEIAGRKMALCEKHNAEIDTAISKGFGS